MGEGEANRDAVQCVEDAQPEPSVEEVRVALALNGGVSLAVWMGGCAVELDRARRAHGRLDRDEAARTHRAYDALCQCFGRRLSIDILTGSSAGGINGALLSAAMVTGRKLDVDFVRKRWLDLGDLSRLLHRAEEQAPRSLMRGDLFHRDLVAIFEAVLGERKSAGADACEPEKWEQPVQPVLPSLDVTMTDTIGVETRFRDAWGNDFLAREHRPRFKFRDRRDFTADALASAARTSASFPIAFEPWPVTGEARRLAGLKSPTYGIDGGLLDNAPIRAALAMIPARPANSRVLRYLCYVNGDPAASEPESAEGHAAPRLFEVAGYTFGLPREAPYIDQLRAIQRAVERPRMSSEVQRQLLALDVDVLHSVAIALFDAYRERRTIQSLQELLAEPGDPAVVREVLAETGGTLPWIPRSFDATDDDGRWQWGTHTAERILHLLLDLLRGALEKPADGDDWDATRSQLLEWRMRIDDELGKLSEVGSKVSGAASGSEQPRDDPDRPVDRLAKAATVTAAEVPVAHAAVRTGAEIIFEALTEHPSRFQGVTLETFFPAAHGNAFAEAYLPGFFRRVLSIEVVRRTFATEVDIESAEPLRFVQLTPAAPSPLFAKSPLSLPLRTSAKTKLTGIGLGHFAGFYRRSWRANDFMWGRLDAAARIVDLLLDAPSADVGVGSKPGDGDLLAARSKFLAEALCDGCQSENAWLLEEALADAERIDVETATDGSQGGSEDLKPRVEARIHTELRRAGSGSKARVADMPFTRIAFQRLAQLEVGAEELPEIRKESERDSELGSASPPIDLGEASTDETNAAIARIEAVREIYRQESSLPGELTARGESVSDLGLRTIAQSAFVGLSAVEAAGVPLAKAFGLTRAPLRAVAGVVARSWLDRAAVVLGFWAAAIYLSSRLLTAEGSEPAFSDVWSWATLAALVAALGVAGVALVPILRARHGVHRWRNAVCALALLASAAGSGALAWLFGELDSVGALVFPPGADSPDNWVLISFLALAGIVPISRAIPFKPAGRLIGWLSRKAPLPLALLPTVGFALLGAFALPILIGTIGEKDWQTVGAWLALGAAPLFAVATVALWRPRQPPAAKRD